MQVSSSSIYSALDRGDGVCKYFDDDLRLCIIYDNRPLICNIDKMYDNVFQKEMTREEYYQRNYKACQELKKRFRLDNKK